MDFMDLFKALLLMLSLLDIECYAMPKNYLNSEKSVFRRRVCDNSISCPTPLCVNPTMEGHCCPVCLTGMLHAVILFCIISGKCVREEVDYPIRSCYLCVKFSVFTHQIS